MHDQQSKAVLTLLALISFAKHHKKLDKQPAGQEHVTPARHMLIPCDARRYPQGQVPGGECCGDAHQAERSGD